MAGLPIICINASLAVELPYVPNLEGMGRYGLINIDTKARNSNMLNVPVIQLTDLVKDHSPTLVKLDCEGCEHYVLEQLAQLPQFGVNKIAVEFHESDVYKLNEVVGFLRNRICDHSKLWEMGKRTYMMYWFKQ